MSVKHHWYGSSFAWVVTIGEQRPIGELNNFLQFVCSTSEGTYVYFRKDWCFRQYNNWSWAIRTI